MSVVNKMLQDLEARQSQPDDINTGYQAPPKKQSKLLLLVLLILAIAAIIFAVTDQTQLFTESKHTTDPVTADSQPAPAANIKKMSVLADNVPPQAPVQATVQASIAAVKPLNATLETLDTETNLAVTNSEQDGPLILPQDVAPSDKVASLHNLDIQSDQPDIPAEAEQTSSFSMTGSSQENNSSSLKQRIAESLNNDDLDLAQSLLQQLLDTEADNIKARKKLASLLFAQGHYARSKRLLLDGIEIHPAQSDLKLMLARLYVLQKEPLQAIKILTGSQPNVTNQIEYLAYRAALANQLKQTEIAKSDYQTLSNIEASNAKWWLGLAIARDQLGEASMAVQAYRKASSLQQLDRSVNDFMQQRITVLAGVQ